MYITQDDLQDKLLNSSLIAFWVLIYSTKLLLYSQYFGFVLLSFSTCLRLLIKNIKFILFTFFFIYYIEQFDYQYIL